MAHDLVIAAIAFEAMNRGFAYYITQFPTYNLVYGAFASLPIFLLWICPENRS